MMRRSVLLVALLGCLFAAVVAGCGSSKSSSSSSSAAAPAQTSSATTNPPQGKTHFAKTKFVFHFGLAAGAFHRYIYRPFKAGVFGKPRTHKAALAKAAIAALFTYHELKLAATDVKSSKILRTLFSPITLLTGKLQALRASFLHGKYDGAAINQVQATGGSIAARANAKGYPTGDLAPPKF